MGKVHIVLPLHAKGQWFQEKALVQFGKHDYQILVVSVGYLADIFWDIKEVSLSRKTIDCCFQ